MYRNRVVCRHVVACTVLMGTASLASTISVPTDYGTLVDAVAAAADRDTIVIEPNATPYTGAGFRWILVSNKRLTIRGGGSTPEETTINLQYYDSSSFIRFDYDPNFLWEPNDAVVENLTVSYAWYTALDCSPPILIVRDCRLIGHGGGAVRGAYMVDNCLIRGNDATDGGGVFISDPLPGCTIQNSIFASNGASGDPVYPVSGNGGAILVVPGSNEAPSAVTITNCTFTRNGTDGSGGAIMTGNLPVTVTHCKFIGNRAGIGGAVCCDYFANPVYGPAVFDTCLFAGNMGVMDPAVHVTAFTIAANCLQVRHCTFLRNHVKDILDPNDGDYGAINSNISPPTVTSTLFWDNYVNKDIRYSSWVDANYVVIQACHFRTDADPQFLFDSVTGTWTAEGVYDANTGLTVLTDANASWAALPGLAVGKTLIVRNNYPTTDGHFLIKSATSNTLTVWGNAAFGSLTGQPYRGYDYHITQGSPCRDVALAEAWTDIDFQAVTDGLPDVGCDEYVSCGGSGSGAAGLLLPVLATLTLVYLKRHGLH